MWYIIDHEMSKSTQTFSGLPKQSLLTISIKATPQCTDLWLGFPELQGSFLSIPESKLLIETRSSQRNHKIFNMDKLTLSLLLSSPKVFPSTSWIPKTSLRFAKLQDYSNSFTYKLFRNVIYSVFLKGWFFFTWTKELEFLK